MKKLENQKSKMQKELEKQANAAHSVLSSLRYSHSTGFPSRRVYISNCFKVANSFKQVFDGMMMKHKNKFIVII